MKLFARAKAALEALIAPRGVDVLALIAAIDAAVAFNPDDENAAIEPDNHRFYFIGPAHREQIREEIDRLAYGVQVWTGAENQFSGPGRPSGSLAVFYADLALYAYFALNRSDTAPVQKPLARDVERWLKACFEFQNFQPGCSLRELANRALREPARLIRLGRLIHPPALPEKTPHTITSYMYKLIGESGPF
jgi:hypothetical protein